MNLSQKYRPRSFSDFAGNPRVVTQCERLIQAGIGGKAILLTGATGIGKTSAAYLLAESIADPLYIEERVGRDLTPRSVDELERQSHLYGGGKGGRAFIINEIHGMSRAVVEKLLDVLEHIPRHVCWVLTTSKDGAERLFEDQIDAGPLTDRCIGIRLTNQSLSGPFAKRLVAIARAEGMLNGHSDEHYERHALRIVKDAGNSMRAAIQRLEELHLRGELAWD